MPTNPPADMPRITAYLLYEDVAAAVDWLTRSFGFGERLRMPGPDGAVVHAEIALEEGVVMMGHPGPDYVCPRKAGHVAQQLYVYVDDVADHYARAVEVGAKILQEPEETFYGDRRYGAEDPEGHQWYFAQRIRDVAPEDWNPPTG